MDEDTERKWPHGPRARARANGAEQTDDFILRLREARLRANMTQKDVADAFGLSTRAVQEWEQGRIRPTRHAKRLAEVLGVDFEWLLVGTDPFDRDGGTADVVEQMKSQLMEQGEELTILRQRISLLEQRLDRFTKPA